MDSLEFNRYGNDIVAYNKSLYSEFQVDLFRPEFLSSDPALRYRRLLPADIKGRQGLHLFTYHQKDLVLRHYYRGGAVARFISDSYLWLGLHRTRAIGELQTLCTLRQLNLPVPTPVAAHVRKEGCTYRADIVTRLIPETQSLSSRLAKNPLSVDTWRRIGAVIRQFHDNNCNHADLNAHNVLLDENESVFLVDFDRAVVGKNTGTTGRKNLARLQRSLLKLKKRELSFHYSGQDFQSLMQGYNTN